MGALVLWAACLVVFDFGAKIQATSPVPVVAALEDCDLERAPDPGVIVHVMSPGETALIRNTRDANLRSRCYEVETASGVRGWMPWHPDHMRGAGIYVRAGVWSGSN